MTSAARPVAIPASIDSHGKPGIAGITRGVVKLEVDVVTSELLVIEGDDVTTLVETDVVVTTLVTIDEVLDELVTLDVAELLVDTLEEELDEELLVVLNGNDVVAVTLAGTPPGGSRWKMSASEFGKPAMFVPTAKPFVLERSESPSRVPVFEVGIEGESVDHELDTLS